MHQTPGVMYQCITTVKYNSTVDFKAMKRNVSTIFWASICVTVCTQNTLKLLYEYFLCTFVLAYNDSRYLSTHEFTCDSELGRCVPMPPSPASPSTPHWSPAHTHAGRGCSASRRSHCTTTWSSSRAKNEAPSLQS